MAKKLIGYQIVKFCPYSKRFDDIPNDLYSFIVFKYFYNAKLYLDSLKKKNLYKIIYIYDGDIENPLFYEDLYPSVMEDKNERRKLYLSKLPNVTVSYINQNQGQIYFKGVVRGNFLNKLKKDIGAVDTYVTFLPTMVASGVVICFTF